MAINQFALGQSGPFDDRRSSAFFTLPQTQAQQSVISGREAAALADPLAPFKPAIAKRLSDFIADPEANRSLIPGFDFGLNLARENVVRANRGVDSGRFLSELTDLGVNFADRNTLNVINTLNNLLGGSGSNAGQLLLGGFNRGQDQQSIALANREANKQPRFSPSPPQPFDIQALLDKFGITPQGTGTVPTANFSGGNFGLPSGGGGFVSNRATPFAGFDTSFEDFELDQFGNNFSTGNRSNFGDFSDFDTFSNFDDFLLSQE